MSFSRKYSSPLGTSVEATCRLLQPRLSSITRSPTHISPRSPTWRGGGGGGCGAIPLMQRTKCTNATASVADGLGRCLWWCKVSEISIRRPLCSPSVIKQGMDGAILRGGCWNCRKWRNNLPYWCYKRNAWWLHVRLFFVFFKQMLLIILKQTKANVGIGWIIFTPK